MAEVHLILGNQLFPVEKATAPKAAEVFMAEDWELLRRFHYHKKRLVLMLSAMRHFREELRHKGYVVHYQELNEGPPDSSYLDRLKTFLLSRKTKRLHAWEIENRDLEHSLQNLCFALRIELQIHPTPMFLTTRPEFRSYLRSVQNPFMKSFYERQRKRLNLLMNDYGRPLGGHYSFDPENRKKLPSDIGVPTISESPPDAITSKVMRLVEVNFPSNPGRTSGFWFPVTRNEALSRLEDFLAKRLAGFGPYEDAISSCNDFVFHSLLSTSLNIGLLLPKEVLDRAIEAYQAQEDVPFSSIEGFVRQIVGWREFLRGIYQHFGRNQEKSNFFNHHRCLGKAWREGKTGLPPLDHVLHKTWRLGWAHHTERLMILGNLMVLCEIHPREAYRWFMEMFVDSSEWVMGPNVYGMAIFSDGGLFATKPYICASNYLLRMSDFRKGPWCDVMDGLFWRFVDRNRKVFENNPRMRTVVRTLDNMPNGRMERIFPPAERFLERITR
ncbi:MAG: cryptochrome/photolyase family protein [Deltaproteobacteria bacterium]|nr:cryptochrome/photolyase family protein [Deltaproteobacteria bacterium]